MVWGASGGIGEALVERLIADDWTVVAIARDTDKLAHLTPHVIVADVSKRSEVEQVAIAAGYSFDQIDLWVYTVGDIVSDKVDAMSPTVWNRILDANLTGAYLTAHYSMPLLAPEAHMFFVGAISERMQIPGLSAYAAAKAGLEAFAEALRKESRKRRVTVVRPGAVNTRFWAKVPFKMPATAMAPDDLAGKILEAYASGHTGRLDL